MNKFMTKLVTYMQGRYGMDSLNVFLFVLSFIVSFLGVFIRNPIPSILSFALLILMILRITSKDIYKRQQENIRFTKIYNPIKNKINSSKYLNLLKQKFKYRKTHKIFLCKCGKMIRVPKNKGKVEVSCPNCGVRKIHRT